VQPPIQSAMQLALPAWLGPRLDALREPLPSVEERMQLACELAESNVEHATGGPFGALVVECATGVLVSIGVNVVVSQRCSLAHAEMLALALAQQRLGAHTLEGVEGVRYQLVTSAEPCAMCLGAIQWSGVAEVVVGARDADVRAIGFDEGAKPVDWEAALARRGVRVLTDVLRARACGVLAHYSQVGGAIYNGRGDAPAGPDAL